MRSPPKLSVPRERNLLLRRHVGKCSRGVWMYRLAVASGALTLGVVLAQTLPPVPTYTYEVVSIHRADPAEQNSGFGPGAQGGLRARNNTALQMLTFAYDSRDYQFLGAPGWAQSEHFDVNLTPDRSEIVIDSST